MAFVQGKMTEMVQASVKLSTNDMCNECTSGFATQTSLNLSMDNYILAGHMTVFIRLKGENMAEVK